MEGQKGWNDSRVSVGVAEPGRGGGGGSGKEEGKVEFIGLAFISSSKGNRILVWAETAESRST